MFASSHLNPTTDCAVFPEGQHNFWSAIPSGRYIFRHAFGVIVRLNVNTPGQPKIAHFQITVFIHQEVGWFQISVNDPDTVDRSARIV